MNDAPDDRQHFTQAVTQLGERQDVVASKAIFNSQGLKVVDKGTRINVGLYERLMRHSLSAPLEESVVSANGVSGESLKRTAASILEEVPFFGRLGPEGPQRKLLLNVIETVPLPEAMAFQLTVARDVRPEIYMNLVRTALVAIWLVNKPPLVSRFDLGMAAAAGLLHDIGMLHVDPVLLQPAFRLNREQRRQLYSHPLLSTTLVERHHQYPREVIRAVSEHQEYLDGSGYPRNLSGDAISTLGRVICLSQVVAAMFAPGRSAPEMQLSVLLRLNAHRYDPELSARVLTMVQPQLDVLSAAVVLLDDPVGLLGEIDAILAQLPLELPSDPAMAPARGEAMALVADHGLKLRRALAGVGAVPDQLAQLGDALQDESVQTELTLLAREASWQLRTLGREARRRWRNGADETYPVPMQQWLDRIDALVAAITGPTAQPAAGPQPSDATGTDLGAT
ncbi:HD domain-containing protein [Comamonadaceae bacterium G21597-S1]|nr:HD domain-containing protein [Comamonadaceae bacterium G21597-S1]